MCRRVTCRTCGRPTWAGCGRHVEQVLADVPASERCACPRPPRRRGPLRVLLDLLSLP